MEKPIEPTDNGSTGSSGQERHEEKVADKPKPFDTVEPEHGMSQYATANLNQKFENPLAHFSKEELLKNVDAFCARFELSDDVAIFRKGALAAQNPRMLRDIPELDEQDVAGLEGEFTNKWRQPWRLYWLVSEFMLINSHDNDLKLTIRKPCVRLPLLSKVWTRRPTTAPSLSIHRYVSGVYK